jgi:hypothetical protein
MNLKPKAKPNGTRAFTRSSAMPEGTVHTSINGWTIRVDPDGNLFAHGDGNAEIITQGNLTAQGRNVVTIEDTVEITAVDDGRILKPFRGVQLGQFVHNKGIYGGVIDLPTKFDMDVPPAHLWIAAKDINDLRCNGNNLNFRESITAITNAECHGLAGVEIEDDPFFEKYSPYERELYKHLRRMSNKAQKDKAPVMSGLFMPTKEILHGKEVLSERVTHPNNIFALKDKFPKEAAIKDQWYMSCTEMPGDKSVVHNVNMRIGSEDWDSRSQKLLTRPVALEFVPLPKKA